MDWVYPEEGEGLDTIRMDMNSGSLGSHFYAIFNCLTCGFKSICFVKVCVTESMAFTKVKVYRMYSCVSIIHPSLLFLLVCFQSLKEIDFRNKVIWTMFTLEKIDKGLEKEGETFPRSVQEESKTNTGSVEAIQEHPEDANKILIGYKKGLVVLWNHERCSVQAAFTVQSSDQSQEVDSVSWHSDGTNNTEICLHDRRLLAV
ncbi:LLGL scribble cell polarity complex component 2 [Acropora cervicornis]|uniref:LLGL scribble cell polarity complex component 2 n=1 Tax=Acropora cervicornis TaxID=6130 RepID=A0AAD9PVZ4_ACRCE|nr:LLGL scribble cell polarity complex component 2 [Acropora cervicornis]